MKTRILIFTLLFTAQFSYAQELTHTQKLASLCKVWGFLKYYHPEVAKGKWDWDEELFKKISLVERASIKEELNNIYVSWIKELGNLSAYDTRPEPKTGTPKNKYLTWLVENDIYSKELIAQLENVKLHRPAYGGKYIGAVKYTENADFTNEKDYNTETYPGRDLRLLALFRYWNMIEYYFPYKYLIDKDWNAVLAELIPTFINTSNAYEYQLAVAEMAADVHDTHAFIVLRLRCSHFAPFQVKMIDNKAVVYDTHDSLAPLSDIRKGDVILSSNDTSIAGRMKMDKKYIQASNESVFLRTVSRNFFDGLTDSIKISYERDGKISEKKIARYLYTPKVLEKKTKEETYKKLANNIGYVRLDKLESNEIHKVFKELKECSGIILELRTYPKWIVYPLIEKLSNEDRAFASFTQPDLSCPGTFIYKEPTVASGGKNKDLYKGKIVVLINEETQSRAEFTAMALKTLPNATLMGSQTAGADGNVSTVTLPGGYKFWMTGLGVYYPDHTETQRIGIVPDIEVHPTIKGIQEGRDEVLERAIAFINTGK